MVACKAAYPLCPLCLATSRMIGCQSAAERNSPVKGRTFSIEDVAKADVDRMVEVVLQQSLAFLRELTRKPYVRNPNQLSRGGHTSREAALRVLFGPRRLDRLPGMAGRRGTDAIGEAFDPDFPGDRVQALAFGMRTMWIDAYNGKETFYPHDALDPQRLDYPARNFEIAFWKLRHDRDLTGTPVLLSNALSGIGDLSFERLAGKLIGVQDLTAQVVADRTNRHIKSVIQGVASRVFFPI